MSTQYLIQKPFENAAAIAPGVIVPGTAVQAAGSAADHFLGMEDDPFFRRVFVPQPAVLDGCSLKAE